MHDRGSIMTLMGSTDDSDTTATTVAATGDDTTTVVSWEPDVAALIQERMKSFSSATSRRPFVVGIVGIPGSGKSTSVTILSSLFSSESCVLPMDGYHYPLSRLRSMDDAEDLVYRRGAPDTFDVLALKTDLDRIVAGDEEVVLIPGFDHAVGDPQPDQHTFRRSRHGVVLCEGLYLLHDKDGWEALSATTDNNNIFDLTVYISASVDTCIDLLKERNRCIPGYTVEEIDIRCDAVDRVNAYTVMSSQKFADITVESACAS